MKTVSLHVFMNVKTLDRESIYYLGVIRNSHGIPPKIQPVLHIFDELRPNGPTVCVGPLGAAVLGSFGGRQQGQKSFVVLPRGLSCQQSLWPFLEQICGTLENFLDQYEGSMNFLDQWTVDAAMLWRYSFLQPSACGPGST